MSNRPGRPRAGEVDARRERVLAAAAAALAARGYRGTTTAQIAADAGVSKESLYSWFGDKQALFSALVRSNAGQMNAHLESALTADTDARTCLLDLARDLLTLLTSPASVAINRAAMGELPGSPELAAVLLDNGRHRTGPLAERLILRLQDEGALAVQNPREAFALLYGLVLHDTQIRVLLGEDPPTAAEITRRSRGAVDAFLTLLAPR